MGSRSFFIPAQQIAGNTYYEGPLVTGAGQPVTGVWNAINATYDGTHWQAIDGTQNAYAWVWRKNGNLEFYSVSSPISGNIAWGSPVWEIDANGSTSILVPLGLFNVKAYGAVGNGSHDDTAAFVACVAAANAQAGTSAGGAAVYLPAGSYNLATADGNTLAATANGVYFIGQGPQASNVTLPANVNGFSWTSVTGGGLNGIRVTHAAVGTTSSSMYINGSDKISVYDFWTLNSYRGININNSTNTRLLNCILQAPVNGSSGIMLHGNSANTYATQCRCYGGTTGSGILIGLTTLATFESCDSNNWHENVTFDNTIDSASGTISDLRFTGCNFDSAGADGVHIMTAGSTHVYRIFFTACSSNSNTGLGWDFDPQSNTTLMREIMLENCTGSNNTQSGLHITAPIATGTMTGFTIIGGAYQSNDTGGAGIHLSGPLGHVIISGANCRTVGGGFSKEQLYGILVDTNSISGPVGCTIADCDVTTNASTGGIFGYANLDGTSVIHDCRGFNPVGYITSPAVGVSPYTYTNTYPFELRAFVSGGTVSALTIGSTATGLTSGSFMLGPNENLIITHTGAPTLKVYGL